MSRPPLLSGKYVKSEWQWAKESQEIVKTITKVLSMGSYKREAARHAGISESTLEKWIERGAAERRHISRGGKPRKREGAYLQFIRLIEKAMADAQLADLALITAAAQKGAWQAAAWKLERRNPSKWGRQRIEADVRGGLVVEGVDWFERKIDAAKGFKGED